MGRIIAVTNLKGGIGKTTTVINVGAGLALKGERVLLVDVDAQGNLALALGVQPRRTLYEVLIDGARPADCIVTARPNLDLLAADASLLGAQPQIARRSDWSRLLEQVLRPLRKDYDSIIIDCGGSLTVLNINAFLAASDLLVPTTIEHLSLKGLDLLFQQLKQLPGSARVSLIIPTMYDPRLRQSTTLLETLQTTYGDLVAPPIRVNVRLSEAAAYGRTIYEYDPRSRGAVDYAQLVEQISRLWQAAPRRHNQVAPAVVTPPRAPAVPSAPAHAAPRPEAPAHTAATPTEQPVESAPVQSVGAAMQRTCPHCGQQLQRATVAGYVVDYCNHCKYKHQELAAGPRR